jgi:drug/metabolite transporter (DMT)-like permease
MAARAPGGGGITSIFWMNSVMLPIALVVAVACGGPAPIGPVESAWLPVSLSVVFYVVGFVMQMRGLRMTSATAGGLVFCLEPVVATISATVVLREHLALSQYAGGIIVLAVILVSLAPPRLRDRT